MKSAALKTALEEVGGVRGSVALLDPTREELVILAKIVAIIMPLFVSVAYLTFAERKIIGFMQVRIGPII